MRDLVFLILAGIFSVLSRPILRIIKLKALLEVLCGGLSNGDYYLTYHIRPKSSADISNEYFLKNHESRMAIVLQGPLILKDSFTEETLRLYRRTFKSALIVLSTWEGECANSLAKIRDMGIKIIENKKPSYFGESSINLQIISSYSGLVYAKSANAEYAIKTRTDQRIYASGIGEYLINLMKTFPIKDGVFSQKERLIACSLNTFRNRLYGISDMFLFGNIDDMLVYWGADLDERRFDQNARTNACESFRSFSEWQICEVYLCTKYLEKLGRVIEWTLEDSMDAYAEHFIIVDKEQLDLFWPKYSLQEYRRRSYKSDNSWLEFNYKDWINLYCGLKIRDSEDSALNKPLCAQK